MTLRIGFISLLFTLCLFGCSTKKPQVWVDQDVSLGTFKAFEIQPVFNASDRPVKQDIMAFLTFYLKEQFKVQNLPLSDNRQTKSGILMVQSDMLVYEPSRSSGNLNIAMGGTGATRLARCILRTELIDKSTNKVVAKILTIKEVGVGTMGYETHEWILKESAAAVAKEVAQMMQPNAP